MKLKRAHEKMTRAPSWEHATEILRAYSYGQASASMGEGQVFTLRLGPDVIKAAHKSGSFASYLQKRLSRYLDKGTGRAVEFWGHLELTPEGGEPHLHGVIVGTASERKALKAALEAAGGDWNDNLSQGRQAHVDEMTYAKGWSKYLSKDKEVQRTRDYLAANQPVQGKRQPSVIFTTRGIRDAGKAIWERERPRMNALKADIAAASPAGWEDERAAKAALKARQVSPHQNELELAPAAPESIAGPIVEIKTPEVPAMPTSGALKFTSAQAERVRAAILRGRAERRAAHLEAKPITDLLSTARPKLSDHLSSGAAPPHSP